MSSPTLREAKLPLFYPSAHWRLLRPQQWTKNVALLIVPLTEIANVIEHPVALVEAFLAFCLCSSAVYVLNDYLDVERDRAHPVKKHRPIASGAVTPPQALVLLGTLAVGATVLAIASSPFVAVCMATYATCNIAYSLKLKHVQVADVLCVSTGFLLRALAGAAAVQAYPHPLLLAAVTAGAFSIIVSKRRSELVSHPDATKYRPALQGLTVMSLDHTITGAAICAIGMLIAFGASSASTPGQSIVAAAFMLVCLAALFRFLQFVSREDGAAENPTRLLTSDRTTLVLGGVGLALLTVNGALPALGL